MAESKAARGLLRALVAGGSLPALPRGVSAADVADSARIQGLSGLLLEAAEADPSSWAGPLVADLVAWRRGALVRGLGQVALAARVLDLLAARGIRALPLKGVVLAEVAYDVESDRPMSDVDVLALERWPEAVAVLQDAGFTEFARGDHAWAFTDRATGTLVELHRSVSSCPGLFPLDADAVWERARPGRGQLPRVSSPEDLLVQLGLHAAFQHGLVLALVQWLDFRRVLERERIETDRLLTVARASRAEVPLAAALLVAAAVVAAPLPPTLLDRLGESLPPGLSRWLGPRLEHPLAFVHPETTDLARVRWELMAGRRAELVWRTLAVPGGPGDEEGVGARAAGMLRRAGRLGRARLARPQSLLVDGAGRAAPPPEGALQGPSRPAAGCLGQGHELASAVSLAGPNRPAVGGPDRGDEPVVATVSLGEEVLRDGLAAFPWVRLTVTGQCMEPALADGAKVRLVAARRRRPRLGDVVLARGRDGLRLHRLVWGPPLALPGMRWRTKADRGRLLDPPLDPSEILATVVAVEEHPKARSRRPGKAAWSLARGVLARWRLGAPTMEVTP